MYWLEALATRGYVLLDHWADEEERENFFETLLLKSFNENPERTLEVLERLADKLLDRDEIRHHYGLGGMFIAIEDEMKNSGGYMTSPKDGYERVKKVIRCWSYLNNYSMLLHLLGYQRAINAYKSILLIV